MPSKDCGWFKRVLISSRKSNKCASFLFRL